MAMANYFKAFILPVTAKISKILPTSNPWRWPWAPPPSLSPDPETAQPASSVLASAAAAEPQIQYVKWQNIIMQFCFTSALELALYSPKALPQHLLSLVIMLTFTTFFISKFVNSKFPTAAKVLEKAGVFIAATGFFIAIAIPLPFSLKCISWAVYGVSFLTVFICTCYV